MKIKHLLCSLSILSSLCYVSSCSLGNGTQIKTVDDIVFESKTFAYDGNEHSIYVNGVPKGWTVTYTGNGQTNPGSYYVTAKITDKEGNNYSKMAQITIDKMESTISADTYQEAYAIPGVGASPTYSLSNSSQTVSVDKYYRPGTYYIDLYAKANSMYKESNHVTVTFVVKEGNELGVKFESKEVIADGTEQELVATNIPAGYTVSYRNNKGTTKGKYNASCDVIDSNNKVVMTLNAVLTIDNPKNQEFEEYLSQFFVDYLGNDYLSWNIFTMNPENFGFIRDYTDIATWYTYESIEEGYLEESYASMIESKSYLDPFNKEDLSYEQEISYTAISELIDKYLIEYNPENGFHFLMDTVYIDQFGGYAAELATYVEAYEFRREQDLIDCLTMIESAPTAFNSYLIYAQDKADAGYPISDYTLTEMIAYLDDVYSQGSDYYLSEFVINKIEACDYLTTEQINYYIERTENAINNLLIPAHKTLADGLEEFKGLCPESKEGYLSSYGEVGKEYYLYKLSSLFGIKDFDPEEYGAYLDSTLSKYKIAYNQAKSKVSKLSEEALNVIAEFNTGASVVGITDPYDMIDYLKEFAKTIVPDLPNNPDISIKYMDDAVAKITNTTAYYMKSPLDSDNSEHITLNSHILGENYTEALMTMAHEGYPGHLYAFNFTKSLDISNIAKIMTSTAHGEGWATYVEYKLAEYIKTHNNATTQDEQKAIEAYLDMKVAEDYLNYMSNTVFDFGIHYKGWTVADLASFLSKQGFNAGVAQDIYSLLVEIPTQYAAYGYGRSHFRDIHDYAKKELGTLYNEIEFNKVIHSHGWCSYDVLEELVDEYIAEQKFIYGIK